MDSVDYEELSSAGKSFAHLIPQVRKNAMLSREERLRKLSSEFWIGYPVAIEALKKLEWLYSHPRKQRMPNLLLVGPTNNGKTMIVEKFIRMVRESDEYQKRTQEPGDAEYLPVVHMQMPPDPTIARFYSMLLQATGAPCHGGMTIRYLEKVTLEIMKKIGLKMLIIDEVHNLLAGSAKQQREFLNLLRMLGNILKIPLVCLGTKEAYLAVRSDPQLENRFEPFPLYRWQIGEELNSLLASFAVVLPLKKVSVLHSPKIAELILEKSEGTIGEISRFLTEAARLAIESGKECIDEKILKQCSYSSPSERRRVFERKLL